MLSPPLWAPAVRLCELRRAMCRDHWRGGRAFPIQRQSARAHHRRAARNRQNIPKTGRFWLRSHTGAIRFPYGSHLAQNAKRRPITGRRFGVASLGKRGQPAQSSVPSWNCDQANQNASWLLMSDPSVSTARTPPASSLSVMFSNDTSAPLRNAANAAVR